MRNFLIGLMLSALYASSSFAQESVTLLDDTENYVFKDCLICPEMVVLPPGNFQIGSSTENDDDKLIHPVHINYSFAVSKTEVTQA